jgi:CheY-like chemotaxis protein
MEARRFSDNPVVPQTRQTFRTYNENATPPELRETVAPKPADQSPGQQIRLLVAEDDAPLRRLLAICLGPAFQVTVVDDGAAAIEALHSATFDAVVCDIMMPRVSGLSVCRDLRGSPPPLCDIPVVLLSARSLDSEIQEVVNLGGVTFMNKPFGAAALRDTLQRLTASGAYAASGAPAPPLIAG